MKFTVKWLAIPLVLLCTSALFPLFALLYLSPVSFNQFLIQEARISQGLASHEEISDTFFSAYQAGLATLWNYDQEVPSYSDPRSMFSYILSQVPNYAVVYPTEGFYYWNVTHPEVGHLSGNIRLADLEKASLTFAYFPVGKSKSALKSQGLTLTEQDGLRAERIAESTYVLRYQGLEKTFRMPRRTQAATGTLLPEERFIGKIFDESGISFDLVYNSKTKSFYEFLDEKNSLREEFVRHTEILVSGKRSKFLYVEDKKTQRKILVAINFFDSRENNYFDGPGDQVPYWIDLKEVLHSAYPATLLGDGIDAHGVYLKRDEWVRIAVSPYTLYKNVTAVKPRVEQCMNVIDNSERLTCYTKEWWNTPQWLRGVVERMKREGQEVPDFVHEKLEYEKWFYANRLVPRKFAQST